MLVVVRFMLYDFKVIANLLVRGIDISSYAIENAKEEVKDFLNVADCKSLPFEDKEFDYVTSINTIHNLELNDCAKALKKYKE